VTTADNVPAVAEVEVREAIGPQEIDAAGRVVDAAYRANGFVDQAYLARLRDASDRAANARLLVAVDGSGEVLGSVTFALAGQPYSEVSRPGEAEFRMLGVRPDAGGRGVGAALVRGCIEQARAAGATAIAICTMTSMGPARRIYERIGFVRDPERDWQPVPEIQLLGYVLQLD
jgi:ribosomal protein S18 acetylase RimI-like enzyme